MMEKLNLKKYLLETLSKDKWQRLGISRRAGVLVPLFSVYSCDSIGIADFSDLKKVIDWCKISGNTILQLLPLNEVGLTFCPYDSISSFALEPSYLSIQLLPLKKKEYWQQKFLELKQKFPLDKTYVDYGIKEEKLRLFWEIFDNEGVSDSVKFGEFIRDNFWWLKDFALYKVIKKYRGQRPWYEWEENFREKGPDCLKNFKDSHEKEILFQMWLQWLNYYQLREIKNYAHKNGILLKGDLPILVSRDSADVWSHPEFFKLEFAAGAPPDMYCAKGQRWGMPTHNWENIAADEYTYLKEKLKYAQNFYDILRIDHVVGLFRIWSIPYNEPLENKGLNGFFDPADENKWRAHGRNILSVMLNNTEMLLCAEDLGVIPKVCPKTLKELGIPGNDVQRWMKDWKTKHDFLAPKEYRGLSVAMLSTHDTTNWPAWYEFEAGTVDEDLFMRKCSDHRKIGYMRVKDKLFDPTYSRYGRLRWLKSVDSVDKLVEILGKKKEELKDFIDIYENSYQEKKKLWRHLKIKGPMREKSGSEIVRVALKISLESSAIFCINTLIDCLYLADIFKGDPYQYRINTPGTIGNKNWSLIIPISLEDLLKHKVNKEIRRLIKDSERI